MSGPLRLDAEADFLQAYTYQGLWQDFHEPPWKQQKWTINNIKAIVVFAVFTTILGLTQGRSWIVWRAFVGMMRPTVSGDREMHLSQTEALQDLVEFVGDLRKGLTTGQLPPWNGKRNTPLFGVAAGLNAVLFLSLGLAIPYFVSEGALSAPIVRSRVTVECLNSTALDFILSSLYEMPKVEAIFQQCLDWSNVGCDDRYLLSDPLVEEVRIEECPFHPSLCLTGHPPIQITHNITPFEVGINSKYKFSVGHRLTCSPLDLNQLMDHEWNRSLITLSNTNPFNATELWPDLTMKLLTHNGPNSEYPDENSGYKIFLEHGLRDLTILAGSESDTSYRKILRPEFIRHDGYPFMVVFRAGHGSEYMYEIDDPLYSAHNHVDGRTISDFEATGLGCVEQYRFCASEATHCTDWGPSGPVRLEVIDFIWDHVKANHFQVHQLLYLFAAIKYWFSIPQYLQMRTAILSTVPLRSQMTTLGLANLITYGDPWAEEVKTWFRKAILSGTLDARRGARFHDLVLPYTIEGLYNEASILCGKILFRNPDYTNIYWVGLWATIGWLMFVLLLSICILNANTIFQVIKSTRKWMRAFWRVVFRGDDVLELSFATASGGEDTRGASARHWLDAASV
ncbi:hypothetical protein EDB80DRAFT_684093 [Ilyonectria destructans]|nr:hypothetical protein EDB80DRAFT_684093 [Ilyonectria destructans]